MPLQHRPVDVNNLFRNNFEGKSSQRVRTRVRTGATLPNLRLMAEDIRAEILSEFTAGRPLRVNRCCIVCYTLNDIVKGM